MNPTVEQWLGAINQHDIDALEKLAATNHRFFVEGEAPTIGADKVRPSWQGYFQLCPNYVVYIDECYELDDACYLLGHTSGSHIAAEQESVPGSVLWRCEIRNQKVQEWSICEANQQNRQRFNLPAKNG